MLAKMDSECHNELWMNGRTERFKIKLEMQTLIKAYNGFETMEIHLHTRTEMTGNRELYVSYSLIWTILFIRLHITWNWLWAFLYMLVTWIYIRWHKSLLMMYHTIFLLDYNLERLVAILLFRIFEKYLAVGSHRSLDECKELIDLFKTSQRFACYLQPKMFKDCRNYFVKWFTDINYTNKLISGCKKMWINSFHKGNCM